MHWHFERQWGLSAINQFHALLKRTRRTRNQKAVAAVCRIKFALQRTLPRDSLGCRYWCRYRCLSLADSVSSGVATREPGFESSRRWSFHFCVRSFFLLSVRALLGYTPCAREYLLVLFREVIYRLNYSRFIQCASSVTCRMARRVRNHVDRAWRASSILGPDSSSSSLRRFGVAFPAFLFYIISDTNSPLYQVCFSNSHISFLTLPQNCIHF